MSARLAGFILLAGAVALPGGLHLPAWAERWLWNSRERTAEAIDAYHAGDAERADAALATALRVAPEDSRLLYDAGTVDLAAGHQKRAAAKLEQAAEALADRGDAGSSALAPRAYYNLGNAQLAGGAAARAVEAYKQSLRLDPTNADAKHNLELALKQLEKKKRQAKKPEESPQGKRQGEKERSTSQGADRPPQGEPRPKLSSADQQGHGPQQDNPQDHPGRSRDEPLPQFRNQPDMSADQAASILEAVENLERQQRQAQAAQRARKNSKGGKDW